MMEALISATDAGGNVLIRIDRGRAAPLRLWRAAMSRKRWTIEGARRQ